MTLLLIITASSLQAMQQVYSARPRVLRSAGGGGMTATRHAEITTIIARATSIDALALIETDLRALISKRVELMKEEKACR